MSLLPEVERWSALENREYYKKLKAKTLQSLAMLVLLIAGLIAWFVIYQRALDWMTLLGIVGSIVWAIYLVLQLNDLSSLRTIIRLQEQQSAEDSTSTKQDGLG